MTGQNTITLDPLSGRSLYLRLVARGQEIGTATGFVVAWGDRHYLITNWHVMSGRNLQTNKALSSSGALPDKVRIAHHGQDLGTWIERAEPLLDTHGNPRWIEHPKGRQVDVAALPLQEIDAALRLYPLDLSLADVDMIPEVAMPVHIIGFPLGLASAGKFPIWKTGHIASEPGLNYNDMPAFLIDATTRGGMSGSPVVLRLMGGYKTKSGEAVMTSSGIATRLLGVYSGRIKEHSEIGIVWRPHVITDILNQISKVTTQKRVDDRT